MHLEITLHPYRFCRKHYISCSPVISCHVKYKDTYWLIVSRRTDILQCVTFDTLTSVAAIAICHSHWAKANAYTYKMHGLIREQLCRCHVSNWNHVAEWCTMFYSVFLTQPANGEYLRLVLVFARRAGHTTTENSTDWYVSRAVMQMQCKGVVVYERKTSCVNNALPGEANPTKSISMFCYQKPF